MQFFVLTKRALRVAREAGTDRYAARHTTCTSWVVSGPFTNRKLAERGAVGALAVHSCLSAQVLDQEQLIALATANSYEQPDYDLRKVVSFAKKWLVGEPLVSTT